MSPKPVDCDVLVIGAGMAGSCLARQLRLQQPDLKIVNIDKKREFDYWVGESTVEAWEDYMSRALRLGPFLEKNFIGKHGLRMFFDSPEKDLAVQEMSEFGRAHYSRLQARNIDRAVFDAGMCAINAASGVDVRLGVEVLPGSSGIELDSARGHLVRTKSGDFRCRWLVDASGRSSPLAAVLGAVPRETRNPSASYWGRYAGFNCIDGLGGEDWRARVKFTQRYHSTCHFMYRGYWIWHIPVSESIVSLGVEFNKEKTPLRIRNGEELTAFLRSHRCVDQVLGKNARLIDFMGLVNLPRCACRHFSQDRWYLAGMSGLFVDVMGSGTSRLYSETNRLIGELIRTDRSGDKARLRSQLHHFNLRQRAGYEVHLRNLSRYDWYGSFDLWPNFFGAGLARYYNTLLPDCMTDLKHVVETVDRHGDGCGCSLERFSAENLKKGVATAFYRLTDEMARGLERSGRYYERNRGRFHDQALWEERPGVFEKLYQPRDLAAEWAEDRKIYEDLFRRYAERLGEIEGVPFREAAFRAAFDPDWNSGQTLAAVVGKMRLAPEVPRRRARRRGAARFALADAETLAVPRAVMDKFGWGAFVASSDIEPEQFRRVVWEIQTDQCVHSWKWVRASARQDPVAQVLRYEEKLRPTVVYCYYGLRRDGTPDLVGVGTVSDKIHHSFPFEGFPVVGRCFIRGPFRGNGLYAVLLAHRLGVCSRRWPGTLRAIHIGTADPRVLGSLERRARDGQRFVCVGREELGDRGERHTVKDFLFLRDGYARELEGVLAAEAPVAAGSREAALPACARALRGHLRVFLERGFGDSGFGRLKELLKILAGETGWLPAKENRALRELVAFCEAVPVLEKPDDERA